MLRQVIFCFYRKQFLRLLSALSFFTAGMLFCKYKAVVERKSVIIISGIFSVVVLVISIVRLIPHTMLNTLFLYGELIFLFAFTARADRSSEKVQKIIVFLSGFSFLVYVTHEFAMTTITKIVYPLVPVKTWCILLLYAVIPAVLAGTLITGGWILKKLLPKIYNFLFCGR